MIIEDITDCLQKRKFQALKKLCNKFCTEEEIKDVKSATCHNRDLYDLEIDMCMVYGWSWSAISNPFKIKLILKAHADQDWYRKPDWAK